MDVYNYYYYYDYDYYYYYYYYYTCLLFWLSKDISCLRTVYMYKNYYVLIVKSILTQGIHVHQLFYRSN